MSAAAEWVRWVVALESAVAAWVSAVARAKGVDRGVNNHHSRRGLLHRHRLGEVAWLVDVRAAQDGDMV